ncbi:hypothetical protein [Actinomadura opuntiae]|uniref:hypothetical protein n=1 Tax=Actinomadura sp. OS1-43 TaxID=604315 RepID=UPI00255A8F6E|nr:hypothetical protein [Actinomadura sp. OS1-43]MDL4814152.1 hypothetical protein [Actinomadura sp. OS1-43]
MIHVTLKASVTVLAVVSVAGCGTEHAGSRPPKAAASSPRIEATIMSPQDEAAIPNPGTGTADPRLTAALLTRFEGAVESPYQRGAAIRLPLRNTKSMFIAMRQVSSYYRAQAPECEKWTGGLWYTLIRDFSHAPGAQLAVTRLDPPMRTRPDQKPPSVLVFSESIITAPAPVLNRLADGRVPAACGRLTAPASSPGDSTAVIKPIEVAPLAGASRGFVIADGQGVVSHWVEIVQFGSYLLEVRIPNQSSPPRGDRVAALQRIARAAYDRAAASLR